MNSERYSDVLGNQLKPAIGRRRRGLLFQACVGSVTTPREKDSGFKNRGVTPIRHILQTWYSAILTSSVPYSPLQGDPRGRHFRSGKEVKQAVHDWLAQQPKASPPEEFIP